MENSDSRIAHSHEASTDERASSFHPGAAADAAAVSPRAAGFVVADGPARSAPGRAPAPAPEPPVPAAPPDNVAFAAPSFASPAEAEAFWRGVAWGARSVAPAPRHPHLPADYETELTRDGAGPGLVSAKLRERWPVDAAPPAFAADDGVGADVPAGAGASPSPTRAVRHDGWTEARIRLFLATLADTGVVADACRAVRMSRDAAYTLRRRSRPVALAWEAAELIARRPMGDDMLSRARHGVIERIYRNGELVAERHRPDNRLGMAVLAWLDRLAEGLGPRGQAVCAVADEFEQFLDTALHDPAAAEAFLAPRLDDPLEPPQFRDARHPPGSEPALLARAAFRERHGVGLPSDIDTGDLDPAAMERWDAGQVRRAEASRLLESLDEEDWPDAIRDSVWGDEEDALGQGGGGAGGEDDAANGMCKLRKLYRALHGPGAG